MEGFWNGPFVAGDHMVQKPPYWRANCAPGHIKQRKFKFSRVVLDVRVRNLLSSMAVFVPCDHQLQKAHYSGNFERNLLMASLEKKLGV